MRIVMIVLGLAALVGCAAPREPRPHEVDVPVAVPCLAPGDVPAKPRLLSRDEILALDDYRGVKALLRDRAERVRYEARLEAVIAGCVARPP